MPLYEELYFRKEILRMNRVAFVLIGGVIMGAIQALLSIPGQKMTENSMANIMANNPDFADQVANRITDQNKIKN